MFCLIQESWVSDNQNEPQIRRARFLAQAPDHVLELMQQSERLDATGSGTYHEIQVYRSPQRPRTHRESLSLVCGSPRTDRAGWRADSEEYHGELCRSFSVP